MNWPANLPHLAAAAQDVFLWPSAFLLSWLPDYSPALAQQFSTGNGENGVALPVILSTLAWSLFIYVAWKTAKAICLNVYYGACRLKTYLICKVQAVKRLRELSEPVPIPQVEFDEFDDLDLAVLNLGSTIPPGFALTAAELSGQLTKRPAHVQRSLDKLRKYGLVGDAIGSTDGFDNYTLTRTGAALLSMWERNGRLPH